MNYRIDVPFRWIMVSVNGIFCIPAELLIIFGNHAMPKAFYLTGKKSNLHVRLRSIKLNPTKIKFGEAKIRIIIAKS